MYSFTLLDSEQKSAEEWALEHRKECPLSLFTYTFNTNSGIGTSCLMKCIKCQKAKDITDYNAW